MSEKDTSPSFLDMSDEELLNYVPPTEQEEDKAPAEDTPATTEEEDTVPVEDEADADPDEAQGAAGGAEDGEGEADDQESEDVPDAVPDDTTTPEKSEEQATVPVDTPAESGIDYKAEYERLTAPFKANGRELAVGNVDDAIALMQMGANYNKKMAALKPSLRILKLLENHGLMSEEKLGFLIDLEKKNPAAIGKLMKDGGIDPLDLDTEKAGEYKPNSYAVDDREIELDTVLDEIQGSATYNRTLDVVSNKWDGASKQVIATSPQLLKVINGHMESGVYDLISTEMERERVFGRLNGLSDIEAYRQVGDAIQARGGFNHLGKPQEKSHTEKPVVVQPKPKQVDEDKLREKRRAAAPPKAAAPSAAPRDFNPLALSDEEFAKVGLNKFL